jgi:hypothetical protein
MYSDFPDASVRNVPIAPLCVSTVATAALDELPAAGAAPPVAAEEPPPPPDLPLLLHADANRTTARAAAANPDPLRRTARE